MWSINLDIEKLLTKMMVILFGMV